MSALNSRQLNAIPYNAPGPAAVADAEAYLSLAVSLAFDLTLSVEVAGVPTATIDIGDRVTVTAAFVNDADAAVDPTTVTFHQQMPDGTITSYVYGTDAEVTKSSTGNYTFKRTATQAGTHVVRCVGTGAAIAAEKTTYQVVTEF